MPMNIPPGKKARGAGMGPTVSARRASFEILDERNFRAMKSVYCWLSGVVLNRRHAALPLLLLSASLAFAQTKEFEVASIKPHKAADDGRVGIQIAPGGHWRAINVPLTLLLNIAYD